MECSFEDFFLHGYYSEMSLVVLGECSLGKTSVCQIACQQIALRKQKDSANPYYLLAGNVDVLRTAGKDGLLAEGVPVLLDDLTPGLPRGTRPLMNLDDVAKFTEVSKKSTISARNCDIIMAAVMPKIITTNATTPHEWHPDLPQTVWDMDVDERKSLSTKVKAVFKRYMFCEVNVPLYNIAAGADAALARRRHASLLVSYMFQ